MQPKRAHIPPLYFLSTTLFQWIIALTAYLLLRIGGKIVIESTVDLKNIKGPIIIAPNHTSDWDAPMLRWALPYISHMFPLFYVSAPKTSFQNKNYNKLQQFLYGGSFFKMIGAYPIGYGAENPIKALRTHLTFLQDKKSVVIFPEGKKHKDYKTDEFKRGVIWLSNAAEVPIIPVAIDGLELVSVATIFKRRRKPVRICFGAPIRFSCSFNMQSDNGEYGKPEAELVRKKVQGMRLPVVQNVRDAGYSPANTCGFFKMITSCNLPPFLR